MGKVDRIYKHNEADDTLGVQPFERHLLEAQTQEILPLGVEGAGKNIDPEALRQQVIAEALSEGRSEAEKRVHEAYEEGLRRGVEEGRKCFEAEIAHCTETLLQAAEAMKAARQQFLDTLEPEIFELVRLIAERVVGREIHADKELVLLTARRALECLTHEEKIRIRVHPADLAAMKAHRITLLEEFEGVQQIEVAGDDGVTPGGCMIDTARMHVDARLETLLGRVLEELAD